MLSPVFAYKLARVDTLHSHYSGDGKIEREPEADFSINFRLIIISFFVSRFRVTKYIIMTKKILCMLTLLIHPREIF